MKPIELRARDLVGRLGPDPVGVELGVFRGQFAALLLKLHPTLHLHMVDRWNTTAHQPRHGRSQQLLIAEATGRTEFAAARRTILQLDSLAAARAFAPASLDFVFIDADHSYEAVIADIEAWAPKVKPGGWLCGHDYADEFTRTRWYGVVRAVDEQAAVRGWALELGPDTTWWVQL